MDTAERARKFRCAAGWSLAVLASIAGLSKLAGAQSIDINSPSPIRTNEVVSSIAPRDLGDPRLTDHFYTFTGTPGDVLITVESSNLNGDVDVFTMAGLRPLLKFTVYSGSSSPTTKSIYLRTREDLLLRVEGRTPNDDNGTYRVQFAGSFQPITTAPVIAAGDNASAQPATSAAAPVSKSSTGKKGRRVSSVGARIDEPPSTEIASAPSPHPTPADTSEPGAEPPKAKSRNPRSRRPANRRAREGAEKKEEAAAKAETKNNAPLEDSDKEAKPTPARKRATKRRATVRNTPKPTTVTEPEETGPKLIIETGEGTLVDRYMTGVRRVTVENGQIVVVGKDGKVQRIQLANVVRMTITP